MSPTLTDEESILVDTVRQFVDREGAADGPRRRARHHLVPAARIEQMKQLGIYGLAVPEEYGGTPVSMPCYVLITQELARGWDESGRGDGRAHRRRQAADTVRDRGAEAALSAA